MNYAMPSADTGRNVMPEMPASTTAYSFPRPGQRPLTFNGSILAMVMTFTPDFPFWYEVNIFRTDDQNFVLVVKMFFQSENEQGTVRAWQFDDLMEVFTAMEQFDAAEDIRVGFPETAQMCPAELAALAYELKAKVGAYRSHWASLVGELFLEIDAMEQAGG